MDAPSPPVPLRPLGGFAPPPFVPLPGNATRWVRERASYDGVEAVATVRQIAGPLALMLVGAGTDTASLTLRLREGTGMESVPVRVYGSAGVEVPLWADTLSPGAEEVTIGLDREAGRAFSIAFDTTW